MAQLRGKSLKAFVFETFFDKLIHLHNMVEDLISLSVYCNTLLFLKCRIKVIQRTLHELNCSLILRTVNIDYIGVTIHTICIYSFSFRCH